MKPGTPGVPSQTQTFCSIERTLDIVGDRWTFLILREALIYDQTRFAGFQSMLGIAPNILTSRLETIVTAGILEKREYKEVGARPRLSYHPTPRGIELKVVLAALQQWGDANVAPIGGPTINLVTADEHRAVHVGFIDDSGSRQDLKNVVFERTANWAAAGEAKKNSQSFG